MSITYSPAQTASFLFNVVDTSAIAMPCTGDSISGAGVGAGGGPAGGGFAAGVSGYSLIRFDFDTNTYFYQTLSLVMTLSGLTNSTEYVVSILKDPDAISTLTNGALASNLTPTIAHINGTAEYYELARQTVTASGTITFDLDLGSVTNVMSTSTRYEDSWNGSLLFWVTSIYDNLGTFGGLNSASPPTLVAYNTISNYTNRDTGSRGLESSRWTRCPVSGLKIPRGKMIMDGFRSVLVAPDSYDPPEPEAYEWTDREDPNEDG